MSSNHKADVDVVYLSAAHHFHSPRKEILVFVRAGGVI
jgi:hypothetical protein